VVFSQDLLVTRRHPRIGEYRLDLLRRGLIPNWTKEVAPRLKPINATTERVASAPMSRDCHARRRCIVPVDNFFEWKAVKGARTKQPYAIAMKLGEPFGIGDASHVTRSMPCEDHTGVTLLRMWGLCRRAARRDRRGFSGRSELAITQRRARRPCTVGSA
jgi:putative SOS response-associated peptidase YedK